MTPRTIRHVDLSGGPAILDQLPAPARGLGLHVVLWWRSLPLGQLELDAGDLDRPAALRALVADRVAAAVWDRLRDVPAGEGAQAPGAAWGGALDRLDELRWTPPGDLATVSVVVCTRDRPQNLARCLASLTGCSVAPHEILVVDNAPTSCAARDVVRRFPAVTYLLEPRPGLSRARNTGVRHATGQVVAFTDDDVTVHPDWVWRLAAAFADADVAAVTGLVLPAELDTPAQVTFESELGGFGRGYERRSYGREYFAAHRRRGVPVWELGAGANMALRRDVLAAAGGFDERLGAGATGCSEDSEVWYRLLAAGHRCGYEPAAVAFHRHRPDAPALAAQVEAYARGHVAALYVQFARHRHAGNLRRALLSLPRYFLLRAVGEAPLPGVRHAATPTFVPQLRGYLRGVRTVGLLRAPAQRWKAPRRRFLRANPYPHPRSEGFFFREKMRAIHRVAPDRPVRRVLEVGGGRSALTSLLYPGADVTSIDIDPAYAAATPNRRPRLHFVAADATRLPFADAAFDAVTLFDVLEHIPDDAAAVREVQRVLRPGGVALVTSPNERWRYPYHRILQPLCPRDVDVMADWGHVRRGYALSELERLFGSPPVAAATFITPATVLAHDVGFSRLHPRLRHGLSALFAPLAWVGSALHRPDGPGTETASAWSAPLR